MGAILWQKSDFFFFLNLGKVETQHIPISLKQGEALWLLLAMKCG